MADLADGESIEIQGSSNNTYTLKHSGGIYSCTCPVWKYQPLSLDKRSCKHLRNLRGEDAERERVGDAQASTRATARSAGSSGTGSSGTRSAGTRSSGTRSSGTRASGTRSSGTRSSGTEPKLLLAHRYKNDINVAGWWMSEKLDGVRALWDGERFISRLGNEYLAPDWFCAQFPSMPLDGELFCGRGQFQKTVSIVRRQDRSDDWKQVRFLVFDAPEHHAVFEERVKTVSEVLEACASPYIEACEHRPCSNVEHLEQELQRVEQQGAEGLMLRQPGSPYQVGRSWTLLKVKSFYDAEARVVAHLEGTGKHMGRLGALMAELPTGVRFKIGTGFTDEQRETPPAIGSIVTFRYQELTNSGVPRFPSFVGERHDIAFEQLQATPRRASPTQGGSATRSLSVPALGTVAPSVIANRAATVAATKELPPPSIDPSGNIYLEFQKGTSVRFWEVEWDDCVVYIEYGRVDREPKTETKTFDDAISAARFVDKQISAKLEKGYVDDI